MSIVYFDDFCEETQIMRLIKPLDMYTGDK